MWFREDFPREYPVVAAAYEDLVERQLEKLFQSVPAEDIAIQWDVCVEVLDIEGIFQWMNKGQVLGSLCRSDPAHGAHRPRTSLAWLSSVLRHFSRLAHV